MVIVDSTEEKLGSMSVSEALALAQEQCLDLVEVSPLSQPPVCKIMDFGQYLYKQRKIEQNQKQSQKKKSLKNIRLSVRIGRHDLEIKANSAKRFLEDSNPVKVTLIFKGRESQHSDLGMAKIKEFVDLVGDYGKLEKAPQKQGNQIFVLLQPCANKTKQ